jgi:hypothetical protein
MSYKDPLEIAIDIRKYAIQKAVELVIDLQTDADEVWGIAVEIENFIVTGQIPDREEEEATKYNPPWEGTPESIYKNWFTLGGSQ